MEHHSCRFRTGLLSGSVAPVSLMGRTQGNPRLLSICVWLHRTFVVVRKCCSTPLSSKQKPAASNTWFSACSFFFFRIFIDFRVVPGLGGVLGLREHDPGGVLSRVNVGPRALPRAQLPMPSVKIVFGTPGQPYRLSRSSGQAPSASEHATDARPPAKACRDRPMFLDSKRHTGRLFAG